MLGGGGVAKAIFAFSSAGFIAFRGLKKNRLTKSGALAALVVGGTTLAVTWRFGLCLLLFYYSSSLLTKFGKKKKAKIEADHDQDARRGFEQVLSCSATAVMYSLVWFTIFSQNDLPVDYEANSIASFLLCSYMGFFACCNGDTWASELGTLSDSPSATMITTMKDVPKGTNGGLSVVGTLASVAGGAFIGLVFYIVGLACVQISTDTLQWPLVPLGALMGFTGSMIDSLLGATLQESWVDDKTGMIVKPSKVQMKPSFRKIAGSNILSNEQVNLVSATVTSVVAGLLGAFIF